MPMDDRGDGDTLTAVDTLDASTQDAVEPVRTWTLGNKFEVLGEIGEGAAGVVLKVRHRELDRVMAVKVLKAREVSRERMLRFRREAQVATSLDHPNIVKVYDLDRASDGTPFMVMEHLEGEDLQTRLARRGPIPLPEVVSLLEGVADALEQAHSLGVVHRDLKPANLFQTTSGVVKILDFGVCHYRGSLDDLTESGEVLGTPLYMAPEQIRGAEPTPATDVFALAAIIFHLVTGMPPFRVGSLYDLAQRSREGSSPGGHRGDTGLDPRVYRVLARGMSFDPRDRPPGPNALLDELRAVADRAAALSPRPTGHPGGSSTPGAGGRSRRSWAVLRWVLGALFAGMLALGLLGILLREPGQTGFHGPLALGAEPPTLLVLPFDGRGERTVDRHLWPLVDRMIVHALAPEETLWARVSRVDPLLVSEELERRELGLPLDRAARLELARVFHADVVLWGRTHREGGLVHLDATLQRVGEQEGVRLHAARVHLRDAAELLADRVSRALWDERVPDTLPDGTEERFWVREPESARAIAGIDLFGPEAERERELDRILAHDQAAVGALWIHFLADFWDERRVERLVQASGMVGDPQLQAFFSALDAAREDPGACARVDLDGLGARYPVMLGALARSTCALRAGGLADALAAGLAAWRSMATRPLAQLYVYRLLARVRTCEEQLPTRETMQREMPEFVLGWSNLATWYARCDHLERAQEIMKVARAMLGPDHGVRYEVAYNGALIHLVAMDPDGARRWLDLLEQSRDLRHQDHGYFMISSLYSFFMGRWSDGVATLERGLREFDSTPPGYRYSLFVTALFYHLLTSGELDRAEELIRGYEQRLSGSGDTVKRYEVAMMFAALDAARGNVDMATLRRRMARLGQEVQARQGERGASVATANEALVLSHVGSPEACRELLRRTPSGVDHLMAGCRYRAASLLLAEGRLLPALEGFRRAYRDVIWTTFLYTEFLPGILLGWASAAEAAGRGEEAARVATRLVRSYGRSERIVPEVAEAMVILGRLGGAGAAAPAR